MTTITLPDDVPLDRALRCALEYGLVYDHDARTLSLRATNPGAGRASEAAIQADGSALQHRPAPDLTQEIDP